MQGSLEACLEAGSELVVAVSGGVDSMTLAVVAQSTLGSAAAMFHAISAAVPPDASARVRRYAERDGWRLEVADAGEFEDERYVGNPTDRCYFCKSHLYSAIAKRTSAVLVSGTNLDDLDDYRPGLAAAAAHQVRHPYVEAGIAKKGVRSIARMLDLDDLAELPAAPCLASRIETGIAVDPRLLTAVDACERLVGATISSRTVRCRVRRQGLVVELDTESLSLLDPDRRAWLTGAIAARFDQLGVPVSVDFTDYRMGSAFLRSGAR
ncbi:MAG: adenine nucleotide alpha hydrolase [bacterium]|nr:adenine nucleotide alpha hydrolase [bacterium]